MNCKCAMYDPMRQNKSCQLVLNLWVDHPSLTIQALPFWSTNLWQSWYIFEGGVIELDGVSFFPVTRVKFSFIFQSICFSLEYVNRNKIVL